ncbi:MAG: ABC transporter ATP-binding protein [Vicinamibacteria bacterium]
MTSTPDAVPGDAINARHLSKRYGGVVGVKDVSFAVRTGEIFGLLGPNGAGKTTTLDLLQGLREPDGGELTVLGRPGAPRGATKQRLGVLLQDTLLFREAKVREVVALFASFYENPRPVGEVVRSLNLGDKANSLVRTLSGGQRQRLALALALVNDPELLLLDEPTNGLDPQSRLRVFQLLREQKAAGRTVLLTTHHMDEAEKLCDRVAIIDHGEVLACDTPEALKSRFHLQSVIEIKLDGDADAQEQRIRGRAPACSAVRSNGSLRLFSPAPYQVLAQLGDVLRGEQVASVTVEAATLEDVFLKLVGTEVRQ